MFSSKKKNKPVDNSSELISKVNQDLLVRNMPSAARLSNSSLSSSQNSTQIKSNVLSSVVKPENKHQAVGLIIIGGGLILIAALVYVSYIFIIKPQTKQASAPVAKVEEPVKSSVINMQPASSSEELSAPTVSDVATVTPTTIDFVSSSSLDTMAEESSGRSAANLPPILDADNDGLTNDEELILGTNPDLEDSNVNNYSDLVEINNGYNPIGAGKLNTNTNLAVYKNSPFTYEILYPKDWEFNSLSKDSVVVFNAPDDSIIQISVQDNSNKQSILAWYSDSFSDTSMTYDKLKSTATWDGIMSTDGLNFYLTDKKKTNIYTISYIPAVSDRLAYPNIYKLMINSFIIK